MPELIDMVRASAWGQPLQEQPKPEGEKQPAKLTVDELKAVLTEAGVDFPANAKKAELQALFDALPPAGDADQSGESEQPESKAEPEQEAPAEAPKE